MTASPERRPGSPITGGRLRGGAHARLPFSFSTLFIVLGVLSYLAIRTLPPDNSLALVQQAETLNVCFPPAFVPYIRATDDGAEGTEAQLVSAVARRLGLKVGWNLQAGWGQAPDPVDWGLRPESCDLVAGGVIESGETAALMALLPYRPTRWVLLQPGSTPRHVAVLSNHWGLSRDEAFTWGDAHHLDYLAFDSPVEALASLKSGETDAVLALQDEVDWLVPNLPGWHRSLPTDMPHHTLALGVWKTRTTLKRALIKAIHEVQSQPTGVTP